MQIIETRPWKKIGFIALVFKEFLDPWPIIKNSPLFILYNKKEEVSFCTIKNWGNSVELGTVVTKKKYRGKGYSTKLINYVIKGYKEVYVVCAPKLINFYSKFGFKQIKDAPYPIKQRVKFANLFARLFGKNYIIMKR